MIDIKLKPELVVQSRLRVLYEVIRNLAEGFGIEDAGFREVIQKGILQKQLLDNITLYYLNTDGKIVGKVTITIDWPQHQVLARSDDGKDFRIDSNKSILEQISEVYPLLVAHTKKLWAALGVKEVRPRYGYTPEVWANEQKLKEARQFLGTSPAELPQWAELPQTLNTGKMDIELEFISGRLEELKIKIEHNKPS